PSVLPTIGGHVPDVWGQLKGTLNTPKQLNTILLGVRRILPAKSQYKTRRIAVIRGKINCQNTSVHAVFSILQLVPYNYAGLRAEFGISTKAVNAIARLRPQSLHYAELRKLCDDDNVVVSAF
ncbi:hypothetical protein, partial [Celeribacter sp. ULVN23_4]